MKKLCIVVLVCWAGNVFGQTGGKDEASSNEVKILYNNPDGIPTWGFDLNFNFITDTKGYWPMFAFSPYYRYKIDNELWVDLKVVSPFVRSLDESLPYDESPRPLKTFANIQLQGHLEIFRHDYVANRTMLVGQHKLNDVVGIAAKTVVPIKNALSLDADVGLEYMRNSVDLRIAEPWSPNDFGISASDRAYYVSGAKITSALFGLSLKNSFCTTFKFAGDETTRWAINRLFINGLSAIRPRFDVYSTYEWDGGSGNKAWKYEYPITQGVQLHRFGYRIGWERVATLGLTTFTIKYGVDYTNQPHYSVFLNGENQKLTNLDRTFRIHLGFGWAH